MTAAHHPRTIAAVAVAMAAILALAGCADTTGGPSATSSSSASTEGSAYPSSPAGPDRIAFTRWSTPGDGEPKLWTGKADGSDLQPVGKQLGSFPAWSPDRTHLLFDFPDKNGDRQVATIRPDGTGPTVLTKGPGINEAADYSPDGTTIVFDHADTGEFDPGFTTTLMLMDPDGENVRPLLAPTESGFDYEPEYSPDGSTIVFVRYDPGTDTAAVFAVGADGTGARQLTPADTYVEHPRWSPDGATIIYNIEYQQDLDDPRNGIWTIPAIGGEPALLLGTDENLHPFKPDYSPDGSRILFGCLNRQTGSDELCVMNADGTDIHQLTSTATYENHPVWD